MRNGLLSKYNFAVMAATFAYGQAAPVTAEPESVVHFVQDSDYLPYMGTGKTGPTGIYTDIMREADRRMPGFRFEIHAVPWKRALYEVETGTADGVIGTYYKAKERPYIAVFSEPFNDEETFVYCKKGIAQQTWRYPMDFADLVFGNNASFQTPGPEFFDMVRAGKIGLEEALGTDENLRKLQNGRIDCYVQDGVATDGYIEAHGYDQIERVKPVKTEQAFVGFSKAFADKQGTDFIPQFNAVILAMKQDGTIKTIVRRHLGGGS
ncbi:amino acid ABC transporter substrate-binding protein (PAAT family) [Roseibium hamelinense]|uniref:Amino acid ABC transporter substrate-binding protein (PAAT family) n=1 Tax=Roseibium hamelinense TaxID=150831 RepID=A0A562T9B4_9HYPH|nr:transporter substrate-binding domain-containing protein [Roseibium hamelinense]MTI45491.1 transporter substrate-binding domain-containing protein [Roseibium hamelinense]TWI90135.1 amino acid ABC transporter substrate-binding protein (PAAT family) [Roseibium hamelinense]